MSVFEFIFGFSRELLGKAERVEFRLAAEGLALATAVAACVVLAALAVYLYRRSRAVIGERAYALGTLRVVQLALLALILLAPALSIQGRTTFRGRMAVLVDRSASMAERDVALDAESARRLAYALGWLDAPEDELAAEKQEILRSWMRSELVWQLLGGEGRSLLRKLAERREMLLAAFSTDSLPLSGDVDKVRSELGEAPDGIATFLGNALREITNRYRGTLGEVLVLSDGRNNGGLDPLLAAREAREAHVRIFISVIGSPRGRPDSILLTAVANPVVNKGDDVEVVVDVRSRGYDGKSALVQLRRGVGPLDEKAVTLRSGVHQRVSLKFRADEVGTLGLTVALVPQPEEEVTSNNYYHLVVKVADERYKLVYLEGYPRWEYRFLKNLFSRDRGVEPEIVLQSEWQQGTPKGVPENVEAWNDLDVVVLGDVAPEFFNANELDVIRDFVSERGGGLVIVAGEDHMPTAYRGTALETIVPVVLPDVLEPQSYLAPPTEPFQLMLTSDADIHPVMRLEDDAISNREAWRKLPGHWWCRTASRLRPGAVALAEHPSLRGDYGPVPLIATQRFGKGQVLYLAIDSTWRWRYAWGEVYFDRFWGQVVRNLAPEREEKHRMSELSTGRDAYRPGEVVSIAAFAFSPDGAPLEQTNLLVSAEEAGGEPVAVMLGKASKGAPGEYQGQWVPPRRGGYLLRLESEGLTPAAARLRVGPARVEVEDTLPDVALLRQVAELSGGRYFEPWELESILDELPQDEREVATYVTRSLWDLWPVFMLLVGANLAELGLRKRWGLL